MLRILLCAILLGLGVTSGSLAQPGRYYPYLANGIASQVPDGFIPCADDFQNCTVGRAATQTSIITVYYGAMGKYIVSSGEGDFSCQPATFGISDPVPHVRKTCWILASYLGSTSGNLAASPSRTPSATVPADVRGCAVDFGQCNQAGLWVGVYGANGKYVSIAGSGPFTCLPGTFSISDPVENVQKTCSVGPVVFGSFTLRVNPALNVPGVTVNYEVVAGDGSKVGIQAFPVSPGGSVSNLSSITPLALSAYFRNIPSNYCITLYGGKTCNLRNIGFGFPTRIVVRSTDPINGTVGYSSTPPSEGTDGNIAQPTLTFTR
jgi:hypothetical protein